MGQRAGKAVFNSQEALEFGKQVAAALGNTAATVPLRQIIQDTEDVGIANQPVNEEMHHEETDGGFGLEFGLKARP